MKEILEQTSLKSMESMTLSFRMEARTNHLDLSLFENQIVQTEIDDCSPIHLAFSARKYLQQKTRDCFATTSRKPFSNISSASESRVRVLEESNLCKVDSWLASQKWRMVKESATEGLGHLQCPAAYETTAY